MSAKVNRAHVVVFLLFALVSGRSATAQGWVRESIFGSESSLPRSVERLNDGSFIASGLILHSTGMRILLTRFDAMGHEEWRYHMNIDAVDQLDDVEVTPEGRIVACGTSTAMPLIMEFNDEGDIVQRKRIESFNGSFRALKSTEDGGFIAVGRTFGDMIAVKFDSALSVEWAQVFGTSDEEDGVDVACTQDGGYVLAGQVVDLEDLGDVWLVKLDSEGRLEWSQTYGTSAGEGDDGQVSIESFPNGDLFVSVGGNFGGVLAGDIWTLRLNDQGDKLFERRLSLGHTDAAYRAIATDDGGVFLVGNFRPQANDDNDALMIKLDANGLTEWGRVIATPERDYFADAVQTRGGGFVVIGGMLDSQNRGDVLSTRVNAEGNIEGCLLLQEALPINESVSTPSRSYGVVPQSLPIVISSPIMSRTAVSSVSFGPMCEHCPVVHVPFGVGLAGSGGFTPELSGDDGPCSGRDRTLHIVDGLGSSLGMLWIGFVVGQTPAFGGDFYVDLSGPYFSAPIRLGGAPGIPGAGFLDIPGSNLEDYVGLNLYLQAAFLDSAAPRGVSLTQGLMIEVGE